MLIIHTMHTFVRVIPSRVSRVCLRHRAIACWMRSTSSVTSGGGGAGAHAPYVGPFKSGSCGKPSTSCAASSASVVGWCAPSNTHPIYSSLLAPRVLVRSLSLCAPALGRTTNHAAKNAADLKRGKLFAKICRDIGVAVKIGGSDLEGNPRLAAIVALAKKERVPKERIERALQAGGDTSVADAYTIEATAVGGAVKLLIETSIEPKQRGGIEASDLRKFLVKQGADLKDEGTLKFFFEEKFVVTIVEPDSSKVEDPEELAIDVGAEDVSVHKDGITLTCDRAADVQLSVLGALQARGIEYEEADVRKVPHDPLVLDGDAAAELTELLEALGGHDSIVSITTNVDLPD